jgi:hypothetical protein
MENNAKDAFMDQLGQKKSIFHENDLGFSVPLPKVARRGVVTNYSAKSKPLVAGSVEQAGGGLHQNFR